MRGSAFAVVFILALLLSPHTCLFAADEIGGAGVLLEESPQGLRIAQIVPGGGGATAGLQVGDIVTKVGDESVQGIPIDDVGPRIVGPVGSQVKITVSRDGEEKSFNVTRAKLSRAPGIIQPPPQAPPQPAPPQPDEPAPAQPAPAQPAPAPPPAPAPALDGTLKFTRLSIKDPGINNIEAVSFLIPAGWKPEGGITWMHDYAVLANLLMKITDPQTGAQLEFLPIQKFTHITNPVFPMQPFSNYMGQIVHPPITDIPQFIQTMYAPQAMRHLQGAQIVAQEELAKVAEQVTRNYQGQSQAKAARVRYAYEHNGQAWEEDVYLTLVYTPWQMGTMWSIDTAYAMRAPRGQLDRQTAVMATTIKTLKLNLDWFAGYMYVQKLFNNRMHQDIKNAAALSATITRNAEETRKLYADAYRERSESMDRINQSFGEYIKGVDTYSDPYKSQPVELPAGYKDAWVNPAGEYILSEQQSYNPNVGSTTEWRRMDLAK